MILKTEKKALSRNKFVIINRKKNSVSSVNSWYLDIDLSLEMDKQIWSYSQIITNKHVQSNPPMWSPLLSR